MNPLDRLLRQELWQLLERVSSSIGEGTLARMKTESPALCLRVEAGEARLADLRARLLGDYAAWQAALGELEDLWALAELKRFEPGEVEHFKSAA